ncbi:aspartate aminotransferase family protein [Streptomyces sp. NPDC003247]|uniref:aspartate aminotransferase family protein n=1 Tax=Streptomyces sp. NPDC003247 TaxID=3364677 RepID=UPI0036B57881
MESETSRAELTEPYLTGMLAGIGLAVEYVRAEGNTLHHLGDDGSEIPVVDYCGGYASLFLGHNNPEIVAHAQRVLSAGTPVLTQFSPHSTANDVALKLNEILRRETGATEPYFAHFASTGAEAVETAVKQAEFDRVLKVSALLAEIGEHVEQARALAAAGGVTVADGAWATAGLERAGAASFEDLAAAVVRHNTAVSARPPVLLALEGSFHGKLMGSVQFTHNTGFRSAFAALGAQARFVPLDQPDVLAKTVDEARARVLDVVVEEGTVRLVERDFPVFCAFLVEPIQGEGGIRMLGEEFAAEVQRVCAEAGCPLIIDEIQTGVGRTGSFFASAQVGLRGDYYVLAKSLGGGIAKCSVALVGQARYRQEFELVHSSTFAKDGFSCAIALKVLELLEADDGAAYRTAAERGARLREMLDRVRADHPDVVEEVRGKGLLQGLEFRDQSQAPSELIGSLARQGVFGYAVAGFLLRRHRIRVLPTASAPNTLRFAPSVQLTDAEIDQLEAGLRDLCTLLHDQDEQRLMG